MIENPRSYEGGPAVDTCRWYVVLCKPRSEKVAVRNLARQGYSFYFPELLARLRAGLAWRERIGPLFPRYLFVGVGAGQVLAPVRSTLGVADLVRFGREFAQVPARVIESLRARADAATGLHRLAEPGPLAKGAPVRIVSGAFDGLEGIFLRSSGDDRVFVLLELLGASTCVQVPAACVAARGRTVTG